MKIRFENNSVRFRLRKSEIEILRTQKTITETIAFPISALVFQLHIKNIPKIIAETSQYAITLSIPEKIAIQWIASEEVGIYYSLPSGENKTLDILIEKDFPCKNRPEENKSDTFIELSQKNEQGKIC